MKSVLILFAHPRYEASRVNQALLAAVRELPGVTIHDLYEKYPDFFIDVATEKELLQQHDTIVWQHPFYWYSCPPLLKQWTDLVLEFGWAYGPGGHALQGKQCLNAITTGGSLAMYCAQGSNVYSVNDFLRPFEQTAAICGMEYLPPFAVMGTHKLETHDLNRKVELYAEAIQLLQQSPSIETTEGCAFLTDIPALKNKV